VLSESLNLKTQNHREKTNVLCPECGRRTGTRLGEGDAIAYCRYCKLEIEVIIHVIRRIDLKTNLDRA
jgi:ribosomal protein L37AE/L43A